MSKIGLNLSKKSDTSKPVTSKPALFNEESDEEPETAAEKFEVKYSSNKSKDRRMVDKVLADDPNAYLYDEVYDEIEKQKHAKTAEQIEKDKEKAPKYADKLLIAKKRRDLERLLVEERQYKKERETEGDAFEDKDTFITGAYRKQIEERTQFAKELAKSDYIDTLTKVENQKMWQLGFHRKLLNDLTSNDDVALGSESKDIKQEPTEIGSEIKPDVSRLSIQKKEEPKKKSIYSSGEEESEPEIKPEKQKRFEELRPGLNIPKSKEKTPEKSRDRRRRSRSHSLKRSPDRSYQRRSGSRRRQRSRHSRTRSRDRRRTRSRSYERLTRSRDQSSRRERRTRHDSRSPSQSPAPPPRTRSRTPELKKIADVSLKIMEEEKHEELTRRLQVVREMLKQRNTAEDIEAARQRHFERQRNGEVPLPV